MEPAGKTATRRWSWLRLAGAGGRTEESDETEGKKEKRNEQVLAHCLLGGKYKKEMEIHTKM